MTNSLEWSQPHFFDGEFFFHHPLLNWWLSIFSIGLMLVFRFRGGGSNYKSRTTQNDNVLMNCRYDKLPCYWRCMYTFFASQSEGITKTTWMCRLGRKHFITTHHALWFRKTTYVAYLSIAGELTKCVYPSKNLLSANFEIPQCFGPWRCKKSELCLQFQSPQELSSDQTGRFSLGLQLSFKSDNVDGSEIRRSPVDMVNFPSFCWVLTFNHPRWCRISSNSSSFVCFFFSMFLNFSNVCDVTKHNVSIFIKFPN